MRRFHQVILVFTLLLLVSCSKAECKTSSDCTAKPSSAFTISCASGKCNYAPIPGKVGNGICETGENKCTAPQDCLPPCIGKVPGTTLLTQQCVNNECIQDVQSFKGILVTADVPNQGDKFKIDTEYNQPFNLKKDTVTVTVGLTATPVNTDHFITRAELTAQTKERRTVTLARNDINKPLFSGSNIALEFPLEFPADPENDLTGLALTVEYRYNTISGGKKIPKTGTFKTNYKEKFTYVSPQMNASCPTNCDDKNAGTRDYCSAQTNFFCAHEAIPNACGNFNCDSMENRCTCPQDCGPCTGSAGSYTDYTCKSSQCVTVLRSGTTQTPQSLFDDRNLGAIELSDNYKFPSPYNAKHDKIELEFKIYKQDPSISKVVIETVRLLEGQQQLAEANPNQELSTSPSTVTLQLPAPVSAEDEVNPTLGVWYLFVQNDKEQRGNFQKPLGKFTVISADS